MPADRIRHQHEELMRLTERLHGAVAGDFDWQMIDGEVAMIEKVLSQHFHIEEQGGYMSHVLAAAPNEEANIRRLRGNHDELWMTLQQIRKDLSAQAERVQLRDDVLSWIEKLHRHEEAENLLLSRLG